MRSVADPVAADGAVVDLLRVARGRTRADEERRDQFAALQQRGAQARTGEHDAEAAGRRRYAHAGIDETDAVRGFGPRQAGGVEPGRPGLQRATDQGGAPQVGRRCELQAVGIIGRAHRAHLFVAEYLGAALGMAVGKYFDVRAGRPYVEIRDGKHDVEFDVGVPVLEVGEAGDQDILGECRRDADPQGTKRPFGALVQTYRR